MIPQSQPAEAGAHPAASDTAVAAGEVAGELSIERLFATCSEASFTGVSTQAQGAVSVITPRAAEDLPRPAAADIRTQAMDLPVGLREVLGAMRMLPAEAVGVPLIRAAHGTSYISAPGTMTFDSSYPGAMPGAIIEGPIMGGTIEGGSFGQPTGPPQSIIDGQGVTPNEGGITPGPNQFEIPPTPGPTPANDADEIASLISNANSTAVLSVNVPEEAKVYINGRLTRTEGDVRSYVSRGLKSGKKYDYRVKAVLSRNGKEIVRNHSVKLVPGLQKLISFDFDQPATTTIALKVPSDAEVILSGNKTSATGRIRYYATQELEDGESWKDYKILVSVNRDGKTITQEKTIDISAGEMRMVAFDFDNSAQIVKK